MHLYSSNKQMRLLYNFLFYCPHFGYHYYILTERIKVPQCSTCLLDRWQDKGHPDPQAQGLRKWQIFMSTQRRSKTTLSLLAKVEIHYNFQSSIRKMLEKSWQKIYRCHMKPFRRTGTQITLGGSSTRNDIGDSQWGFEHYTWMEST